MLYHYNHSESWRKDAGNKRTSTYVNIKTVNDDCNNTDGFVRVLFWVHFEKQCCQENIHKTYFWSTFMHNYTQRHEEALVSIRQSFCQEAFGFLSSRYWFLIEISHSLCFRSFKSPTSSSKLLMPLDLETGFWSVLWTAPRSALGSIMQLVTRSAWLVTISLRDGGRPPTGLMTKWSAPPTIPDWYHLSTERYCAHRRALTSDVEIAVVRANVDHSQSISLSTDYRDL